MNRNELEWPKNTEEKSYKNYLQKGVENVHCVGKQE